MTNQQRLEQIQNRLEILNEMDNKINAIITMLSDKRNNFGPDIQFTKANPNVDDSELKSYEMEIFSMLDKK